MTKQAGEKCVENWTEANLSIFNGIWFLFRFSRQYQRCPVSMGVFQWTRPAVCEAQRITRCENWTSLLPADRKRFWLYSQFDCKVWPKQGNSYNDVDTSRKCLAACTTYIATSLRSRSQIEADYQCDLSERLGNIWMQRFEKRQVMCWL